MSDPTRSRINAAFEDELAAAPVPPGLRALAVRGAIAAPRRRSNQPQLLALVAAILAVAIIATLVLGSHLLRQAPLPSRPTGSSTPPASRAEASAVYDEEHGVMVVFGGNAGGRPLNETWTWDGKYWTHQHPTVSPPARQRAAMAYDLAHHDTVLFGGWQLAAVTGKGGQGGLVPVNDTWTWNGTTWRQMHPSTEPVFGFDYTTSMQFDPVTGSVLLFGLTKATDEGLTTAKPQTWSWNGSDWKLLNELAAPRLGSLTADGSRVLLLAPGGPIDGRYITQTWAWDGASWRLLSPQVSPPQVGFASAAYDPQRRQVVMLTGDTWTWDGTTWARQHPVLQPVRPGYMVYMSSLREVVSWGDAFGGQSSDTYAWNGTNWVVIVPPGVGTVPKVASPGTATGGYLGTMSPEQAAAAVRATVVNTRPVLLPSAPPAWAYDARVSATADDFTIDYASDLRDKTLTFGIMVANPPPGSPSSSSTSVRFRNSLPQKYGTAGYATYFVYDPSSPTSQRWLMWSEPGTMANPQLKDGGVPYFLATTGLTDQEFWQVANSLR